jgi:hypothetical protein
VYAAQLDAYSRALSSLGLNVGNATVFAVRHIAPIEGPQ